MADKATNKPLAETAIVALYPEVTSIEADIDAMAALGRQFYIVSLISKDHQLPLVEYLTTTLPTDYVISGNDTQVKISWQC